MDRKFDGRVPVWQSAVFYICCLLFGVTFIFSGFVKAIDPLGTVYKIEDYLVAMHLDALNPLSGVAAFALFSLEFLTGMLILLNIRFREGLILGTAFMAVMTPLTLWIAVANPVTDCGCFGDALVISNTATFWKNVVLCLMVAAMWVFRRAHRRWVSTLPSWLLLVAFLLIPVSVGCYSLHSLPFKDFRPYHIGASIEEGMEMPEGAEPDQYETTFVYMKDGETREFTLADAPYNDSTWTFVEQHTELIKKGYTPPIHDFSIITMEGDDVTYDVLDNPGRTYLAVMYDLTKTDRTKAADLESLYLLAQSQGAGFYALTASVDLIEGYVMETGVTFPFAMTDPIQLKTMVRDNPGVLVIENGIIIDKWNVEQQKKHLKKLMK